MIVYDNIISTINRKGGIKVGGVSILFNEIIKRLGEKSIDFKIIDFEDGSTKRLFERYRDCRVPSSLLSPKTIFHSTYYRLPKEALKTITTVHDFTYEKTITGLRKRVHSIQKNHAIRNSEKIICVSENTKNDLLYYLPDISESNVHVVYNGASKGFYPIAQRQYRDSVVYVGRRGRFKNFDSVVHALSLMKTVRLECVGGGDLTKEEINFLDKMIPRRYEHLGSISETALNETYNRSICLVYPSLYEGFGIPIVEAMRAGCPVIATNSSSIPEVAGDAAILLEKSDPYEIKEAIETLINNERRSLLIARGLEQAKKFDWDITFEKTINVYEEMLDEEISATKN
ncbi:glycosyltransferase family 4 protein [Halomonas sp. WWR20]